MTKQNLEQKIEKEIEIEKILKEMGYFAQARHLYKKIEEERDWSNPDARMYLGEYLVGDGLVLNKVSDDAFRSLVKGKFEQKTQEINKLFYENIKKIVLSLDDEKVLALAGILSYIPFRYDGDIKKEIKQLAEYHKELTEINEGTLEEYRAKKIAMEKNPYIRYGISGLPNENLKILRGMEILEYQNLIAFELKKLKEKYTESEKKEK